MSELRRWYGVACGAQERAGVLGLLELASLFVHCTGKLPGDAEPIVDVGSLPHEAQRVLAAVSTADNEIARLREGFAHEAEQVVSRLRQERAGLDVDREFVQQLVADRVAAIGLLAGMWADFERAYAAQLADELRHKTRPAPKAADAVRSQARNLAAMRRRAVVAEWTVALYEWHFPWLSELRDDEEQRSYLNLDASDEEAETGEDDPARSWLSAEEWSALDAASRGQLALDRYLRSRKTPWQVGRDYERYIGYLREQAGWQVSYQGIFAGLEDLGRDLIAHRDGEIEVIQCKRWARSKTIHEKHVFQLFGTVVALRIERPDKNVRGTFVTTTNLSDRARAFASQLNVEVQEDVPLDQSYPRIKCNIARDGERIYHLPFDQQYDKTVIDPSGGEKYVTTCAEAESGGFRRAWRWQQDKGAKG